jgi:phosphoglycolate phosphatase
VNESASAPAFLFDLDGTLADSAKGIISSLNHALALCGVDLPVDDWTRFIGPPLPQLLQTALPQLESARKAAVVAAYRKHYATSGMFETVSFPGIPAVLASIAQAGCRIYVVTNKPQEPAEGVIHHLGLSSSIFKIVGGDPTGGIKKEERTALLAEQEGFRRAIFVGDAIDDVHAAERVGARFLLAGWGYGTGRVLTERPGIAMLADAVELLAVLEQETQSTHASKGFTTTSRP